MGNGSEQVTHMVEALRRQRDYYHYMAEGADSAFEAIASASLDTGSVEEMLRHIEALISGCELGEEKPPDVWHGELVFYGLARRYFENAAADTGCEHE